MRLATILEAILSQGRRIYKYLRLGPKDVQTSHSVAPFGIDSCAPANTKALVTETGISGQTVVIGVINSNQMSEAGCIRLFSVDGQGNVKAQVKLLADGSIEVIGESLEVSANTIKLTGGDIDIDGGKLTNVQDIEFTSGDPYKSHTHTDSQGGPTSVPT